MMAKFAHRGTPIWHMAATLWLLMAITVHVRCNSNNGYDFEEECDNEEEMVERCARDMLLYRNESLPQTEGEIDDFCRNYKEQERCLRDHSNKCLSHSANQAIMELIRGISQKNQAICSSKHRRQLFRQAGQCLNQQRAQRPARCYTTFINHIQGLHQFSQDEKIPIICCNYHEFLNCLQGQMKFCPVELTNLFVRLMQNYSGETLNYVCREFKSFGRCGKLAAVDDLAAVNETKPETFFSLLVKIYLS